MERRLSDVRRVGKSLLMPALAARALAGPPAPGHRAALLAQACSWGGDLALEGRGRVPFLGGVGFFLGAQASYIAVWRSRSSVPVLASPARRRLLAVTGSAAVAMGFAARRTDRALALPVAAYGVLLATMVTAAAAVDEDQGHDRVLAGALLFLASDTLIGIRKFLTADRQGLLEVGVMTTYAGAQWCLGDGVRRSGA